MKVELRPLGDKEAASLREAVEAGREQLKRRFGDEPPLEGQAIVELRTGRVVGVASVKDGELRLWVRPDRQDRGLAGEAGRLALARAFKKEGLHRVHARIDPANRPARKVLQKLGFHYEGCLRQHKRLNGRWVDQECWGILKSEWKP